MIVLIDERTDERIRNALPTDIARAKQSARIPVIGGYAYLAHWNTDASGNTWSTGLTDDEIRAL